MSSISSSPNSETSSTSTSTSTSTLSTSTSTLATASLTSLVYTSSSTTAYNGYNGCKSKVEFGTMIDLSREVAIYCSRMCDLRCETIISDIIKHSIETGKNFETDRNFIACTKTCPVLCSCNLGK